MSVCIAGGVGGGEVGGILGGVGKLGEFWVGCGGGSR